MYVGIASRLRSRGRLPSRQEARQSVATGNGRRLRVAQIGCGQISTAHFKAYGETDLVDLTVVVDADPVAAQEASAANGGVPWTTSFEEAIARDDVDFVS